MMACILKFFPYMIFLYLSHSGDISKIRASMKINKYKTQNTILKN